MSSVRPLAINYFRISGFLDDIFDPGAGKSGYPAYNGRISANRIQNVTGFCANISRSPMPNSARSLLKNTDDPLLAPFGETFGATGDGSMKPSSYTGKVKNNHIHATDLYQNPR